MVARGEMSGNRFGVVWEMLSHITFYSPFISKLSFEYFDLVLSKTRYSSHLSFLSRCLQFKVIPKGFKSSFKLHFDSPSNLVTKACYEHSRRLMRIAIGALVKHIQFFDSKISVVKSKFLSACPVVLQKTSYNSSGLAERRANM